MRRLTVLTLLASGLAAAAPAVATASAPPLCQGQPATVVGGDQSTLTGTEGDDVIVTGGAVDVFALGGDDLVCAGSSAGRLRTVDAGTGDDAVEVRASFTRLVLGDGSDRVGFSDDARRQGVYLLFAGTPSDGGTPEVDDDDQTDDDADVLDLRDGHASRVYLGQDDVPLTDRVRLRSPFPTDLLVRGTGLAATGQLVGDALARLTYLAEEDTSEWTVRLAAGRSGAATSGSRHWEWTHLRASWATPGSVRLAGTAGADTFEGPVAMARLGDGDDDLTVTRSRTTRPTQGIDGGGGSDVVRYLGGDDWRTAVSISIRVGTRIVWVGSGEDRTTTRISGFESYVARSARTVALLGGRAPERLQGRSCDLHLLGGGGDDRLVDLYDRDIDPGLTCRRSEPSRRSRMLGMDGDDVLVGGTDFAPEVMSGGDGDDRITAGSGGSELSGGAGDDVLVDDSSGAPVAGNGGPGVDRCVRVERRTSCER